MSIQKLLHYQQMKRHDIIIWISKELVLEDTLSNTNMFLNIAFRDNDNDNDNDQQYIQEHLLYCKDFVIQRNV